MVQVAENVEQPPAVRKIKVSSSLPTSKGFEGEAYFQGEDLRWLTINRTYDSWSSSSSDREEKFYVRDVAALDELIDVATELRVRAFGPREE